MAGYKGERWPDIRKKWPDIRKKWPDIRKKMARFKEEDGQI
jgi:hypothetical protein